MTHSLTFDAIREDKPGPKWKTRWDRSWPAYEAWFVARGGDTGPDRAACDAAIAEHMPELVATHAALTKLAGNTDRAAQFLSAWCPPAYLGGCSLMAMSNADTVRLVRNYDLSPDLNEGLLLCSSWGNRSVMGMVEFLWGLSDGINSDGLSVALAYGGGSEIRRGFGICMILRYVLETCADVPAALKVLARVPSHMGYNLVLADAVGRTTSVEMLAGGGMRKMPRAVATNHQHGASVADRPAFTRTKERYAHIEKMFESDVQPSALADQFLKAPLFQENYAQGFGTLFTAEYDPKTRAMALHWPTGSWPQTLDNFQEGSREISYDAQAPGTFDWVASLRPWLGDAADDLPSDPALVDWQAFGMRCAGIAGAADVACQSANR